MRDVRRQTFTAKWQQDVTQGGGRVRRGSLVKDEALSARVVRLSTLARR